MTITYADKTTDIYKYPQSTRQPNGTITIGDLHGNAVKLLYFLLHNGVVGFKNFEESEEAYQSFVDLYEKFGDLIKRYSDNQWTLKLHKDTIPRYRKEVENLQSNPEYDRLKNIAVRDEKEEAAFNKLDRCNTWLDEAIKVNESAKQALDDMSPQFSVFLDQFNTFMEKIEIKDNLVSVRLIGDEFADRGSCDYFTLRLLNLLKENQVKVTTLLSNHSNEFIAAYENLENNQGLTPINQVNDMQKRSFLGLKELLDQQLITEKHIIDLVDFAYKPTLKILDYTITTDGIRLFTHAPVAFDAIKDLADGLGVVYNDATKEHLGATIDKINTKFHHIVQENKVHEFFKGGSKFDASAMSDKQRAAWPLLYFTWNRIKQGKDTVDTRPPAVNDYKVEYVHGHDGYQSLLEHITNLDTGCGKESRDNQNEKIVLAKADLSNPNCREKKPAQEYMDGVFLYKILDSTETGLKQRHNPDLINKQFQQINETKLSPVVRKSLITGLVVLGAVALSILVGGVLVGTGLFAPFGATLLGGVYLCLAIGGGLTPILGLIGFGVAHFTQEEVVEDTRVVSQEPEEVILKKQMTPLGPRVEEKNNIDVIEPLQNKSGNSVISVVNQDKSNEESFKLEI